MNRLQKFLQLYPTHVFHQWRDHFQTAEIPVAYQRWSHIKGMFTHKELRVESGQKLWSHYWFSQSLTLTTLHSIKRMAQRWRNGQCETCSKHKTPTYTSRSSLLELCRRLLWWERQNLFWIYLHILLTANYPNFLNYKLSTLVSWVIFFSFEQKQNLGILIVIILKKIKES